MKAGRVKVMVTLFHSPLICQHTSTPKRLDTAWIGQCAYILFNIYMSSLDSVTVYIICCLCHFITVVWYALGDLELAIPSNLCGVGTSTTHLCQSVAGGDSLQRINLVNMKQMDVLIIGNVHFFCRDVTPVLYAAGQLYKIKKMYHLLIDTQPAETDQFCQTSRKEISVEVYANMNTLLNKHWRALMKTTAQ